MRRDGIARRAIFLPEFEDDFFIGKEIRKIDQDRHQCLEQITGMGYLALVAFVADLRIPQRGGIRRDIGLYSLLFRVDDDMATSWIGPGTPGGRKKPPPVRRRGLNSKEKKGSPMAPL